MHVLLQPCGDPKAYEHFERTILQAVPASRITSVLDAETSASFERMLGSRRVVSVWGVMAGVGDRNVGIWERITPGDLALFARHNAIMASAFVIGRGRSRDVARMLWGADDSGATWEYLYFLDGLTEHRIPYEDFNLVVGYQSNAIVRDFRMLDDEKSDAVVDYLDITDYRYQPSTFYADHRGRILARLAALEDLEISRAMKNRLQRRVLRNLIFADAPAARCCMCGREYPVEFMVAGRLKKAAACSFEERHDFANIAAPMCQNGCFTLYERGYVVVNGNGVLERGRGTVGTGAFDAAIDLRVGKLCSAWSAKTAPYFAWHYAAQPRA